MPMGCASIQNRSRLASVVRDQIKALLAAPDRRLWIGRRDYCLLLTATQTGMRLSELVGLDRSAVTLDAGAQIRCFGKGRKERVTPLTKILGPRSNNGWTSQDQAHPTSSSQPCMDLG